MNAKVALKFIEVSYGMIQRSVHRYTCLPDHNPDFVAFLIVREEAVGLRVAQTIEVQCMPRVVVARTLRMEEHERTALSLEKLQPLRKEHLEVGIRLVFMFSDRSGLLPLYTKAGDQMDPEALEYFMPRVLDMDEHLDLRGQRVDTNQAESQGDAPAAPGGPG